MKPRFSTRDILLDEILSQPRTLRAILNRHREDEELLWPKGDSRQRKTYDLVLLTGMGTSYFALYPACIHLNERGVPAIMLETSELLHYHSDLVTDRVMVVLVSQSGETVEARKLLNKVGSRTFVVGVTNDPESHVAANSDLAIALCAGPESGPASKSYTASLAVLLLWAVALTSDLSSQQIEGVLAATEAMAGFLEGWEEPVNRLSKFLGEPAGVTLLGRGPSLASAQAGSLILKEVAKLQSEAMSAGQFRHGPLEIAAPGFAAFVFAPEGKTKHLNLRLARDIAEFGGKVILVSGDAGPRHDRIFDLALPALEELYAPIAEIVPLQLLARKMALDKGLQPGKFDKAGKVTRAE
jgi:glucosamine--fructose-6-phosphate aminotransferase (isomerizing)